MSENLFSHFTQQYSLIKTLRFSLIPILTEKQEKDIFYQKGYKNRDQIQRQDKIEKFFNENKQDVFEVDIERKKRYRALKYYLTELHKLFIKDALGKAKVNDSLNFSSLFEKYKDFEKEKDDNKKSQLAKGINEEKARLVKFFGNKDGKGGLFQKTAEDYYDWLKDNLNENEKIQDNKDEKQKKNNILLSQNVLLILAKKIKNDNIKEKVKNDKDGNNLYALNNIEYLKKEELRKGTLTEYFQGWSTYFKNFNEIRGNLYKDDGRKVDEGDIENDIKIRKANAGQITTRILDENFEIFVMNSIWAETNKKNLKTEDFQNKDIEDGISIFTPEFYVHCLLQTDINTYNAKIVELNKFFNENKKPNSDIKYLKTLQKQLLLTDKPDGEEDYFVYEILDDDELIKGLEEFSTLSREKIKGIKTFLQGKIEYNLEDIQLNENQLHYFCNKYFGSWSYIRDLYYQQNNIVDEDQAKKDSEFKDKEGISKVAISLLEIKELLNKETVENFIETIKNGWFCRDYKYPSKTNIDLLKNAGVYKEESGNFENFLSFLKFELDSLLNGRAFLTKREQEDKEKIKATKQSLKNSQKERERVDELLLNKFSEENFTQDIADSFEKKQEKFESAFTDLKKAIENKQKLQRAKDFECKKAINEYCTRISDINRYFALFSVPEGVTSGFLNTVVTEFKEDNQIVPLFNAIRNYITKRPEETEKVKLNFDYNNLLDGWVYKNSDHPASSDYHCRLFRKNDSIFLGIVGDAENNLIDSSYELMDYYQIKGQTIFGSTYAGLFNENKYTQDRQEKSNKELLNNIDKIIDEKLIAAFPKAETYIKKIKKDRTSGLFDFEITREQIDRLFTGKTGTTYDEYRKADKKKVVLEILRKNFRNIFNFNEEADYLVNKIGELFGKTPKRKDFKGVDKMVYELTKLEPFFYKISFNAVKQNSNDTKIKALFQIYSKDFSPDKNPNSKKNLHTLYFEELFSKENEENPIFKLSGGAEVFFREKIDDYKVDQWEKKRLKNPKTDKLPNKKRRFTGNQILFHLPIVLNNINDGGSVNRKVHEYIQENEDVKIIGIDRGEKELAYYCLLDQFGTIIDEPKTLNTMGSNVIDGVRQPINYRNKLDIRERERMIARRSWTKIEGIKDLKQGYISNVVNEIAKLMVDNDAFICLEELNHGFKKDRSIRIEKGVYQRLENALVDKLNYLVLEKTPEGVRNARQLTEKNRAIKSWGNQMGALFYTDAKFTSKTCPNCGFRKRGVSDFNNRENLREKIKNGDLKVFFEKKKDRFRIEYNWNYEYRMNNKTELYSNRDLYDQENNMEYIYSDVIRSDWYRKYDPTIKLKEIFKAFYQTSKENIAIKENHFSYSVFIEVFNIILNIRNRTNEEDIISCPKCHFSTLPPKVQKINNGDANGAYNIARKGLMIFEKIRSEKLRKKIYTKKGIESKDLKITLQEWDELTYSQWNKKDWNESNNERGL
ncbi:hypothetical protein COW99_00125 [Candidatus Roizmanbacteria bacterium CG22_combo_CG10-13_8_21_14_all_38_20]|uniref:Cas12a RuvC nuclease domain-containing protein n=1 Tax=Candidatus Roizmanbacteria bacterium CG22_combo_CG10-13_8_21_14_all_38_20 TaxID=1974862 RepID=A0A2H0BYR2_9BACT|nr:MAG: hypothetical protein COW99_00125 [Candidatus Roizmanbacteria bacterium CG22_combo_CG10-13_8_21_14_all_38_20]